MEIPFKYRDIFKFQTKILKSNHLENLFLTYHIDLYPIIPFTYFEFLNCNLKF